MPDEDFERQPGSFEWRLYRLNGCVFQRLCTNLLLLKGILGVSLVACMYKSKAAESSWTARVSFMRSSSLLSTISLICDSTSAYFFLPRVNLPTMVTRAAPSAAV